MKSITEQDPALMEHIGDKCLLISKQAKKYIAQCLSAVNKKYRKVRTLRIVVLGWVLFYRGGRKVRA